MSYVGANSLSTHQEWQSVEECVTTLKAMAIWALKRMYRPDERLFAFRLRRENDEDVLEGTSLRYTAIALLGLAGESSERARDVLHGHDPSEVCDRLLDAATDSRELGEVALSLWAASVLRHRQTGAALESLRGHRPDEASAPTVEVSWALSALIGRSFEVLDGSLARRIADRLLESFRPSSGVFPHWPSGARSPFSRRHVTCFADFVYPIQALSLYGRVANCERSTDVARRCAKRMCDLQGPAGQWWWHFDVRTGRVVERYPVYAVHQDAMAPMALRALRASCGVDHSAATELGLRWLMDPVESRDPLVDKPCGIIWRKIARHEPRKLTRSIQAGITRVHPRLRVPGVGLAFRPGQIDFESRPYHMGWILHAWAGVAQQKEAEAQGVCPENHRALPAPEMQKP